MFLPGLFLILPYYLFRMRRRGGYANDYTHRLGNPPNPGPKKPGVKRVWIQAVSVGELQAIRTIIDRLHADPSVEIVLTTTTSTGYAIAKERYQEQTKTIAYFPLDFVWFSKKCWDIIQPDLCILMESELWPEHIHQANRRNIPIGIVNARLSDRSFKIHSFFSSWTRKLFAQLSFISASSKLDTNRFLKLGASAEKVNNTGNIKCDSPIPQILSVNDKANLLTELGFSKSPTPLILCGGSTWSGEERMLLNTFKKLQEQKEINLKLLIIPRHMERREELKNLLKESGLSFHIRSSGPASEEVNVCIADTTGEMTKLLQVADLVFIGKSMPPNKGGQTPIESGLLNIPMLFGPNMSNFRQIAKSLVNFGAAKRVQTEEEFQSQISELLLSTKTRLQMSRQADKWSKANTGALDRTLEVISKFY